MKVLAADAQRGRKGCRGAKQEKVSGGGGEWAKGVDERCGFIWVCGRIRGKKRARNRKLSKKEEKIKFGGMTDEGNATYLNWREDVLRQPSWWK